MRTTLCSSLTRCFTSKWFILFAIALVAMVVLPAPTFAQNNCLQDEFNLFNGDTSTTCAASPSSVALGCSANDVSVSTVAPSSVHNITNPNLGSSCFQNLPFDFVAEFEVVTTSKSSRSNVGLYFATLPPCSATVTTNCNPPEPAHSSAARRSASNRLPRAGRSRPPDRSMAESLWSLAVMWPPGEGHAVRAFPGRR